ncbi:MAG: TerC family protein [Bacteroidetes bacterium]|nr:TerC family protein [Bacteroidota bacterium]MDA0943055.1 TerC family protein [Bacteroidota bacterium]MDA1112430.1 TerC family protein [Bacteroidota bacterium]
MFSQEALLSLLALTSLEIILGIDNIVFISILSGKVAIEKQKRARQIGLLLGMGIRILMLMGLQWIQQQDQPLFELMGHPFSGKSIMLLVGGLFLLYQSVHEIHLKLTLPEEEHQVRSQRSGWNAVLIQMALLNIVFSLDSVITAVGMAKELWVMIVAVVASMLVMLLAAEPISKFVQENISIKILALSFLVMIGVSLLAEAFDQHLEKGYIYFAMAFSFAIEMINLRIDKLKNQSSSK